MTHRWRMRVLVGTALLLAAPAQAGEKLIVFAAASTTNTVDAIAADFAALGHGRVTPVYDATSRAARQIAEGAPAQVLIAASPVWADWLIACGGGDAASRRRIAGNRLVLITPAPQMPGAGADFTAHHPALTSGRFALADPQGVPAGIYARQALQAIGAWDGLSPRAIRGGNVRTVLAWVGAGAVDAAIVYASDAAASPRVAVAARIPDGLHDAIVYEAVAVHGATPAAYAFVAYLASARAAATFARHGFTPAATGLSASAASAKPAPVCS